MKDIKVDLTNLAIVQLTSELDETMTSSMMLEIGNRTLFIEYDYEHTPGVIDQFSEGSPYVTNTKTYLEILSWDMLDVDGKEITDQFSIDTKVIENHFSN